MAVRTKTELKQTAQNELMHGIGNVLGYWLENPPDGAEEWTEAQQDEYARILRREANRVAKLFGFEEAWSN